RRDDVGQLEGVLTSDPVAERDRSRPRELVRRRDGEGLVLADRRRGRLVRVEQDADVVVPELELPELVRARLDRRHVLAEDRLAGGLVAFADLIEQATTAYGLLLEWDGGDVLVYIT